MQFGDVSPSQAADEELRWFFNEAESACEEPSNFVALLAGVTPEGRAQAVEARAEAIHAAGKIRRWLETVSTTDACMLEGLYRERVWSRAVIRALGPLAGAVAAWPTVRVEHLRALACARTEARTAVAWLEELVAGGHLERVARWRQDVERACAIAVRAYDRARDPRRPSVVPAEEEG